MWGLVLNIPYPTDIENNHMKVNLNQNQEPQRDGKTFIATDIKKESERFDQFGNKIDPLTKQIISTNSNEEEK